MSAVKNRRGRPRRNNITALQQNQTKEVNSTLTTLNVNIKEPMTILIVNEQEEERDNSDKLVDISRLPKVNFIQHEETVTTTEDNEEQQLQEQQLLLQHFGDHKNQSYKRPENHYIHYNEPSDIELYENIEYDMDNQDKAWLALYNKERSKELLGDISSILFECIMDKLEKEWFNLIKDAPKAIESQVILPEDSACAVCDDTEVENSNAIVFCDGCNVAVHQDCYGIPFIPEGQWLCRKCMISPENPVSCIFCPNEGGAFKQTDTNQWGHLLCAIWIPEIGVSNTVYMEPIDMIENVPKNRWKLTCFICRKKQGACIQCDNKHCCSSFHVTCAKSAKLCMKMNTHPSQSEGVILKAYCDKHTPKEHLAELNLQQIRGTSRGRGRGRPNPTRDNKVARAHQHQFSTKAPIVPDAILVKIENLPFVRISSIRKRPQVVTDIAHYWSLKRESRRGAPLLKRLHLEPWTASSKYNDNSQPMIRKSVITQLRTDLDKIRMLSEQVQKRERQKLERTKQQKMYIEMILFPLEYVTRPILTQFMEIDKKKLFLNQVTTRQAPDYHLVIKQSMCFSEIYQKLSTHQYTTLDQFKNDVSLIWENSMAYNKVDTSYYKVATKLKLASEKLFAIAEEKMARYELKGGIWDVPVDEAIFDYEAVVESEEQSDIQESDKEEEKETPEEIKAIVVEKREPKYKRKKRDYQVNPKLLKKLRTRTKSEPTTTTTTTAEDHVQSLTIQDDKQTTITSYFAEQQRKEQQRKEERERKRLEEEERHMLEQQARKEIEVSPPAEIICYDIETMQPIIQPKPLTPPPIIDLPINTPIIDLPVNTIMSNEYVTQEQPFVEPSQPAESKYTTIQEAFKVEPSELEDTNMINTTNTNTPPTTTNDTTEIPSRKRKRSTRLTRSAGLKASIEELTKRPKISHEARTLFASYNGVSHLEKPVEVFKENRKKSAPVGWVYLEDEESTTAAEESAPELNQEEIKAQKKAKRERNNIPVPNFKRGEIVWAQVTGYPSHPAKFINLPDDQCSSKLLANRRYHGDILVEFLCVPENHKWGWVSRNSICEVGDPEEDKKRLSESLKKKPKKFMEEAKEGYRYAGKILGLDPEPILDAVFNHVVHKKKKKAHRQI